MATVPVFNEAACYLATNSGYHKYVEGGDSRLKDKSTGEK